MWREHMDEYDVAGGRVVPYSMVDTVLPELKRFNLVICDESHNLRNNGTVAYEAIHNYIRTNDSKVLLLTATPYNLAFEDVANQIGLYIDEDDDLGIIPSAALAANPNIRTKVDGKITTLAAFRESENRRLETPYERPPRPAHSVVHQTQCKEEDSPARRRHHR